MVAIRPPSHKSVSRGCLVHCSVRAGVSLVIMIVIVRERKSVAYGGGYRPSPQLGIPQSQVDISSIYIRPRVFGLCTVASLPRSAIVSRDSATTNGVRG